MNSAKPWAKKIEPVFGPARKGDIRDSNADISKARELLGYDPDYDFEKESALPLTGIKKICKIKRTKSRPIGLDGFLTNQHVLIR